MKLTEIEAAAYCYADIAHIKEKVIYHLKSLSYHFDQNTEVCEDII